MFQFHIILVTEGAKMHASGPCAIDAAPIIATLMHHTWGRSFMGSIVAMPTRLAVAWGLSPDCSHHPL